MPLCLCARQDKDKDGEKADKAEKKEKKAKKEKRKRRSSLPPEEEPPGGGGERVWPRDGEEGGGGGGGGPGSSSPGGRYAPERSPERSPRGPRDRSGSRSASPGAVRPPFEREPHEREPYGRGRPYGGRGGGPYERDEGREAEGRYGPPVEGRWRGGSPEGPEGRGYSPGRYDSEGGRGRGRCAARATCLARGAGHVGKECTGLVPSPEPRIHGAILASLACETVRATGALTCVRPPARAALRACFQGRLPGPRRLHAWRLRPRRRWR